MSTMMTWQTESMDAEQTERIGEMIGEQLRGGEVIELVSDLGGGKTTFTRGLVRGTGSTDKVASPTFTISREYEATRFTMGHFDFYRLEQAGIVADELNEVVHDPEFVTIVEWGEVVHDVLPEDRVTLTIAQTATGTRTIVATYPEKLTYLFMEVAA